jgi:tetratricopeptide (TPR) repeat protein
LYEQAYAIDPENIYIWRHIAKSRTQVYDYDGAVRWWWRVINTHKHPSHYRRLAYSLACLGDFDQAAEICEEAIKLDDKDAKCYAEWGNILYQLERYDEAIEKLQKAGLFDPDNRATYLLRIAEVLFTLGQYRDALRTCSRALTYEPNNLEVPFWMMKICQAMRPSRMTIGQVAEMVPTEPSEKDEFAS